MRFSIRHLLQQDLEIVVLRDNHSGTEARILPHDGALLHEFSVIKNGVPVNVIDNYRDRKHLSDELAVSYKGAKLSPFPCRIPDGKYEIDGHACEFQRKFMDGSAIHGILFNKSFQNIHEYAGDDGVSLQLEYEYRHEDAGYPYDYSCVIEYVLAENNRLKILTTIRNQGNNAMPIADGWHPYFKLGGRVDDWILQFNSESIVEFDDKLIPTGVLSAYNEFNSAAKIGDIQLDNCFLLKDGGLGALCTLTNTAVGITLSLVPDQTYPYLQIYIPPERESIALENLSAAPNCFNNKMGLLMLAPNQSQTFTVFYQLGAA